MDSVCSCFHVPEVEENAESNSSNHSGGARIKKPKGPSYDLKTKVCSVYSYPLSSFQILCQCFPIISISF